MNLVGGIRASQVQLDFICGASENRRATSPTELASGVVASFASDRDRILREYGRRVKKRAMLPAVETMAKADAVWAAGCDDADITTRTTVGQSVHFSSP